MNEPRGSRGLALGIATLSAVLVAGAASRAEAVLTASELKCRTALARASRVYFTGVHRARQTCLRQIYVGKLSPLTDCIRGFGDPSLKRIDTVRDALGVAVSRNCVGIDLTALQFPGRCPTSGAFDTLDLEDCAADVIDAAVADMLEVESPPPGALSTRSLPCVAGVSRHGGRMVKHEVRGRERCLLEQDQGFAALTCREPLPPYGPGTGMAKADKTIIDGYVDLLAGVPAACKVARPDRIGFTDSCADVTGGRFTSFDLKYCVFENHQVNAQRIIDAAFPREAECGNGEVEGSEECDDGNKVQTDGCLNTCKAAKCGDAVVQTGSEECDDGNTVHTDACLNTCKSAKCGDAVVRAGAEECDDGNTTQTDPCLNDCKWAKCGDGFRCQSTAPRCTTGPGGGPEACDDGNATQGDGCSNVCAAEVCGDGVRQPGLGEQCDNGSANSNTTPDACRSDCKAARCGDNVVDSGETCDPPNGTNCSSTCTALLCGNGNLDTGEQCDDGPANSNTTPDACRTNCTLPRCGDGVTDPSKSEACDDGNTVETDACRTNCQAARCGDGVVRAGVEECDDGNTTQTDACLNTCKTAKCGDGFVRAGVEECDDKNTTQTDTCLNNCKAARCGDGFVCSAAACVTGPGGGAEPCDAGTGNSNTAPNTCRTTCALPGCGDGVVDNGEQCDGTAGTCPGGGACGTTCFCANECPGSGELTILSGDGRPCTQDSDCLAGACILERCRTSSRLDTGMTGLAHGADITDAVVVRGYLQCGGSFPCGECQVEGLDPSTRACRCANNNRTVCNEPFSSDPGECPPVCRNGPTPEKPCATNADCGDIAETTDIEGECNKSDVCNCYFGTPLALSSGNTPACVVNRFAEDVFGTANVDTGSGGITTRLRSIVFTSEDLTRPCPYCVGDPVPNDGVRGGTCVQGKDVGKSCDVNAYNWTFPAPDGGGHSIDCFPDTGKNVSGQGLRINLTQTTGRQELKISGDVICGFPTIPALRKPCWCLQCSGDSAVSCTTHAECEALGVGKCNSTGGASLPPNTNQCDGGCVPVDGSDILGECEFGPDDAYCDAVLRTNGDGYIQCQTNDDCAASNIGIEGGACTQRIRRPCFLDPVVSVGEANPSTPLGGAAFCVPPTASGAINTVAGIPGPARVLTQVSSKLFCASDPSKVYTPGVGGCR